MNNSYHVTSQQRVSGTSSNFKFNFKSPIAQGCYDVDNIQFTSAVYNITSVNNVIPWTELGQSAVQSTITPGNYDEDSILTAIKTAMEADADSAVITVTFDEITGKLTIASTVNIIINDPSVNSAQQYLGLSPTTSYAASVTGTGVLSLDYPRNVFVKLSDFSGNISTQTESEYSFQVPMHSGFRSLIYLKKPDYESRVYLCKTLKQVQVSLHDADDNPIDNNGSSISFTIRAI